MEKAAKIEKKKWTLHQAFAQAKTIKGYRFLDSAGLTLNRIGQFYKLLNIDPGGCLLTQRKEIADPYEIRFSSDTIWLHYAPIDSLTYLVDTAPEWIIGIAKDIEVKNFRSLGLRSQFFVETENIIKSSTSIAKIISGTLLQDIIAEVDRKEDVGIQYAVRFPIKKYIGFLRLNYIRTLVEGKEPVDYPADGFLFDIDIYWRREQPNAISRNETAGFLKTAADMEYEMLGKIGTSLLEEING